MHVLVPPPVAKRLERELVRAGRKEIGGLLMGEHVRGELFRLVDISVQRGGGTDACFVRQPDNHKAQLNGFFARTGRDYSRFNYIGEWHSHPGFEALPSGADLSTMQSIVEDPEVGVNFLVLLVCRMASHRGRMLELTATAFRPGALPIAVPVSAEPQSECNLDERIRRFLGRWPRRIN